MDATENIASHPPALKMVKINTVLGLALSISLLVNLTTSSIKSLLTTLFLLLVIIVYAPSIARKVVQLLLNAVVRILKEKGAESVASVQKPVADVMDAMITLLVKAVCGIRAVYNLLRDIFQPLVRKVRLIVEGINGPYEEDVYTKQIPKKAVLLVSLPYGRSYSAMKSALGLQPPDPPFIDWQSNQKSNIPSLISLRTSIRHFALCIVPLEAWDDPTKSLSQKFHNGKFWELVGPDVRLKEGECVSWNVEKIESVNGIVEVGVVSHSDEYVSEQFYRPLQNAWGKYQVIWWNSHDFSIRLAFLLRYSVPANDKLVEIRHKIEKLRALETLTAGSTFLLPVVPVAFPAIAVGSWAFGFGSGIYSAYLSSRKEPGYMAEWRKLSKTLEKKLPQLQGLLDE
ncbi:hypothetical protein K469DRAFT_693839 [Zopfia rhizophila CBS 207.26]|uniref:Uncharacterized protein n=1 Tax=Zopfia rhizophila CBS 207.26 TaxID=1314779 RepID=A0A6A6DL74_9PEZI|nr:hypothetical protein K469DRAFT_693839 [Zopfia rhizophila CBS 207.26]